ncbi:probable xyloglucan endotransglucosylase/hydrolase protein 33 [Cornus florida]|uniref:probable xyloglucan endotransglucosylase/hydrolase protein 33 n=1 Tax=Cornus florida TaxID=4283 RepID=UPI00289C4B04|nr:probable xyloglucan endotransglucosylase/hydrolase protein 33 [Cornus florida]
MELFQDGLLLFTLSLVLCSSNTVLVSSRGAFYTAPTVPHLTDGFSHVSVSEGFSESFGHSNVHPTRNGSGVDLVLNKSSGSGLVSRNKYHHGFFSAAIKLPSGFTSGVVVAFYLSNADVFPHNHDEIDFELLGHEKRREWVLQTNIYGNGSVRTGREEKFYLWFDPTQQFHHYSILWNNHHIVFLVDNVPVREIPHTDAISSAYPSKPMSLHATIWDASEWATHGGKYPVNYKYAPFVASLAEMEMEGCVLHSTNSASPCSKSRLSSLDPVEGEEFVKLSQQQITGLEWARKKLMFYSYCKDTSRYKVLPPECKAK